MSKAGHARPSHLAGVVIEQEVQRVGGDAAVDRERPRALGPSAPARTGKTTGPNAKAAKRDRPVLRESSRKTQETVLRAALEEFATKGYEGARVDAIALRAGLNKNVLYHHFGNKDELFSAVLEHTYQTIRTRQEDLKIRGMDPVEGMRKLVIFTGRIWVQYPEFQRLLGSENIMGGRHVRGSASIARLYNPLFETINELLRRGRESGVFRPGIDPINLYISISALTAHYITNVHTFEAIFGEPLMTPGRIRERLEHAADMVLRYVLMKLPD